MVAKVFNCQNAASGTVFRWWILGNSQFLHVQLERKLTRITCRRKTIVRTVDIGDRTISINLIPQSRKGGKEKISSAFDKNYFTNVSCVFADLRTHCSAAKLRKPVLRALSRVPSYQTKVAIKLRGFPLSKHKKRVAVTGCQKISDMLEITSGFRKDSEAIVANVSSGDEVFILRGRNAYKMPVDRCQSLPTVWSVTVPVPLWFVNSFLNRFY